MAEAIPSPRSNRRIGLLVVILTALVALAAVAADAALRQNVEKSQRSEVLLVRLQGLSYHLSALEWQSIGEEQVSLETAEDVQSTRDEMVRTMGDLEQLDPGAERLRSVRQAYEAYGSAVGEEFRLIRAGDLDQARLLDEEQVDPGFKTLSETVASASTVYRAKARRLERVAILGFALVLLLATAAIALLFWRLQKAQTATERAISEQRALAQREEDLRLLSEMGERLLAGPTVMEAYDVIAESARPLFPNESGALYVLDAAHNVLEAATTWGEFPTHSSELVFAPDECWALRRGQVYGGADTSDSPLCQHVSQPRPASHLCVPMMAHGETLGVLHLRHSKSPQTGEARSLDSALTSKRQLAITVAEHVALALMNITLQDTLRDQAIRDPLSGLFNRRYMEETFARELGRAARGNTSVSVVMLDIDHFKLINDTFGHAAGDAVIVELGTLLRSSIRREDISCRYGGEEFVLVLPGASSHDACRRAEQLRGDVQRLSVQYGGQSVPAIAVSLGLAVFQEHGRTAESLLDAADAAMYRAKAEGGNRLVVAQASGG